MRIAVVSKPKLGFAVSMVLYLGTEEKKNGIAHLRMI
jgi:hypothetical protein